MAFLRNSNRERYTTIDNESIRDDNLSLKALGLLVKLLSLPDNWEFSENGLDAIFKKDGQASIRSGLKELEDFGYLSRYKVRDRKGRITKVEWEIFEKPQLENPNLENPSMDNPSLGNRPQLNTNTSNTEKPIPKGYNTDRGQAPKRPRFVPPTVEEVRSYCKERNNSVDPERFVDYYTSNGWMVGKNHMKDWKASIRTWEGKENRVNHTSNNNGGNNND